MATPSREDPLISVAGSVSDGEPVAWSELSDSLPNPKDRELLAALRDIADVVAPQKLLYSTFPRLDEGAPAEFQQWAGLRIVEKVGEGAHGEVFRAVDPKLDREVALKLLYPEEEPDVGDSTNAVREGQNLARIRHTNVATVYGADRARGRVGIWMELIRGQTLEEIVDEHGPYGASEASVIGIEILKAVSAIHANGLIHRDLKAQNIIREDGGRIVVADFGIASVVEPELEAQIPRGTPLYMAPEALASDSRLLPSSDIYSVGVLLYYLVTRKFPVIASNLDELRHAHERGQRHRLGDIRPDLPRSFTRIVDRALSAEPDKRFMTAAAMEEALLESLGVEARLPSGLVPLPGGEDVAVDRAPAPVPPVEPSPEGDNRPSPPRERTIRESILEKVRESPVRAAVAAASVVLVAWLLYGLLPGSPNSIAERDWILVGAFQSVGANPELAQPLGAVFQIGMGQSRYANVFSESAVRGVLQRMRRPPDSPIDQSLGLEIARREGLKALVLPSVIQVGDGYRLTAAALEASSGSSLFTKSVPVETEAHLLQGTEELTRSVRAALGESLSQIQTSKPLENVTSESLDAIRAFSLGMEEFGRGEDERAIQFFERAIEIDPNFAMAEARLGTVYYTSALDMQKAIAHWTRALENEDRLTEYEALYVRGSEARLRDPVEALGVWNVMQSAFPDDPAGHHNAGVSHLYVHNDFQRAAEAFTRAARPPAPRRFVSLHYLGYSRLGLDELELALTSFEEGYAIEAHPVEGGMADAYLALRRYEDAHRFSTMSLEFPFQRVQLEARSRLGLAHVDRGELAAAAEAYRNEVAIAERTDNMEWLARNLLALATVSEARGDTGSFWDAVDRGVELSLAMMRGEGVILELAPVISLAYFGKLAVRNGAPERGREILDVIQPAAARKNFPPWKALAMMLESELAMADGDFPRAEELLTAALSAVDLLQIRESEARLLLARGHRERAAVSYERLAAHRGRAFGETAWRWIGREMTVLDVTTSLHHGAGINQTLGKDETARELNRRFLEQWSAADEETPLLDAARQMESSFLN